MICGGSVVVTTWPSGQPGNKETKVLKAGDLIEIPTGMPHSLCCDKEDGLQVRARGSPERAHERATVIVSTGTPMPNALSPIMKSLTLPPTAPAATLRIEQFHELVGEGTEVFAKRATTFLINDGFERPTLAVAPSP